jgi:hypothetical protein
MVAALGAGVVAYGLTSRSPGAPPRAGAAPSTRDDAATEGPARDVGERALAAGAPRDRVPQDVATSAEEHGTLALGARVLVRVTDAIDGSALPSATVDASVGLGGGGALGGTRWTLAITGSAGKTTTRVATQALFEAMHPGEVHATKGNLNNLVGAPMVVFGLTAAHRYGIFEIGTNRPGEIEALARLPRIDERALASRGASALEPGPVIKKGAAS